MDNICVDDFAQTFISFDAVVDTAHELVSKFGDDVRERAVAGVCQVAGLWKEEDGSPEEFKKFCLDNFVADETGLRELLARFEDNLEQIDGLLHEVNIFLSLPMDVERGKMLPVDELFSSYDPKDHLTEDFFKLKIAFVALLNFVATDLEESLLLGHTWSREKWAMARLADAFAHRVPASASQPLSEASVAANKYINEYHFYMDKMLVGGEKLFPDGVKLQSHWKLRDYLKGLYTDPNGLRAQRAISVLMNRIVRQEVPAIVINNKDAEWDLTCHVSEDKREQDVRYARLLGMFRAVRKMDQYYGEYNTLMARRFSLDREIPEDQAEAIIMEFLSAPVVCRVGEFISQKLGRPLEPFDIWYNRFVPTAKTEEMDKLVKDRFATIDKLSDAMPDILHQLGFNYSITDSIASKIILEPGRSAGHATGSCRKDGVHRLRVNFPEVNGVHVVDYKSFKTFMHEFGHGVEMFFSTQMIDHNLLRSVPNTAFTEALAFVFQAKSAEVLGISDLDESSQYLDHLWLFWSGYEMATLSLVDMRMWHWMYDHPNATPAQLREATVDIASNIWNQYYGPIMGVYNQPILAIYSHLIYCMLYMPDYFIGGLIQHQIQEYLKDRDLAEEVERMYRLGGISPDPWMKMAVGAPISAKPLIKSTEEALDFLSK